jgi:hypothetical protein
MITFDVRIEFYRSAQVTSAPAAPTAASYVGSITRRGMTGLALPRAGDHVHNLGPLASRTLPERGLVHHLEHFPVPAWHDDQAEPEPGVIAVIHAPWPGDAYGMSLLEQYAAKDWNIFLASGDDAG